ncbi:MAG: transcription elongation factor GreA [Lachnospiraceae bacterium]|nr:transcription elongation factor GreA [Lachnospiraceae bacterium]
MGEEQKKNLLTKEGLKAYEDELKELTVHRRHDVAQKLKEARAQGDLSENAEYDAAKEEQSEIENRIKFIEDIIKNSEIVDENAVEEGKVGIGCTVKIKDVSAKEDLEYKIVGSSEASSLSGRISNESPLGKALIGHEVGETVKVSAPIGMLKYKILKISKTVEA